ncbi:DNA replication complex GINS protein PSF3 [Clonorchis sinensis]|uniref:DNA replication complex GINS protein PSF3 n=1 Tax=Clonorchis sinensis TaxID=79923 RepID=G7YP57_CLOSI|nr:DNA replication complex GINS protein PSF3 [Clonorchis sinensis]
MKHLTVQTQLMLLRNSTTVLDSQPPMLDDNRLQRWQTMYPVVSVACGLTLLIVGVREIAHHFTVIAVRTSLVHCVEIFRIKLPPQLKTFTHRFLQHWRKRTEAANNCTTEIVRSSSFVDFDWTLSLVHAGAYLNIDDILASSERTTCRLRVSLPGLAPLLLSDSTNVSFGQQRSQDTALVEESSVQVQTDVPAGSKLELPVWLALALGSGRRQLASIDLPLIYKDAFTEVFDADPCVVDLRRKAPLYYLLMYNLLGVGSAQAGRMAATAARVFQCDKPYKLRNKFYVGQTGGKLCTRIKEHNAAVKRHDPLSLISIHEDQEGHKFSMEKVKILAYGDTKHGRGFLEAWYFTADSINRCIELDPIYASLHHVAHLNSNGFVIVMELGCSHTVGGSFFEYLLNNVNPESQSVNMLISRSIEHWRGQIRLKSVMDAALNASRQDTLHSTGKYVLMTRISVPELSVDWRFLDILIQHPLSCSSLSVFRLELTVITLTIWYCNAATGAAVVNGMLFQLMLHQNQNDLT